MYAISNLVKRDHNTFYEFCEELNTLGILDLEPVNKLYKRYTFHPIVKEVLTSQVTNSSLFNYIILIILGN